MHINSKYFTHIWLLIVAIIIIVGLIVIAIGRISEIAINHINRDESDYRLDNPH